MNITMDVSIVIINWNTRELLLDCLASVNQTTAGCTVEVIVVDNGSSDGSPQAVRQQFPQVTLIENTENRGFARANNQAFTHATGRYLLLLNSDARLTGEALKNMVAFMDKTPKTGIAACQYLNQDGSKQNSFDNYPTLSTELLNKTLLKTLFPEKFPSKKRNYTNPLEVDSVIGACMIVRAEAIKQVGTLDEDYFFFIEETDWCFRMRQAGWKIYHLPHIGIYHLQGQSKEKNPSKAWIEYYRSVYLFFKKHRSPLAYYALRVARAGKVAINLALVIVGILFTLGMNKRLLRRFRIYSDLLIWHLQLCPDSAGLREEK